jgi:hypothetical protein
MTRIVTNKIHSWFTYRHILFQHSQTYGSGRSNVPTLLKNVVMENSSSISSPDRKGKPGEGKVRWGCAGLVLDSGTDV